MDSIAAFRETFPKKFLREIGFGDNYACRADKFIQADLEILRRKNVVGVRGEAESDWKKSGDPKSRARSHAGKMCMNMADPFFF